MYVCDSYHIRVNMCFFIISGQALLWIWPVHMATSILYAYSYNEGQWQRPGMRWDIIKVDYMYVPSDVYVEDQFKTSSPF